MTIRETIYNRKSTRKYDRTPPGIEVLEDIQNFIKGVKPLFDDIELRFDILPAEKVRAMIGAPYFLAAYSENKDHSRINTGFMLQQMDLYIQSIGLGSCWLGTAKPIEGKDDKLEFVIALGFGRASSNPHRKLSDFRRKPLEKISDNADKRLEAARLAPSAINSQPWFFAGSGEGFDCYCARKFPAALFGSLNKIDMGIALAHLYVSFPDTFRFSVTGDAKPVKGYYYVGKIIV